MIKLIVINEKKINKKIGDIINVKYGYAYNYLIPQKIAIIYNDVNKNNLEYYKKLEEKKEILNNEIIFINKLKEINNLYIYKNINNNNNNIIGYINNKEISLIIEKKINLKIKHKNIFLKKTIKKIGEYNIYIKRNNKKYLININVIKK